MQSILQKQASEELQPDPGGVDTAGAKSQRAQPRGAADVLDAVQAPDRVGHIGRMRFVGVERAEVAQRLRRGWQWRCRPGPAGCRARRGTRRSGSIPAGSRGPTR